MRVCSYVPRYKNQECFVLEGNPDELIREFVDYLVAIGRKSSSLLHEQYAPVFETLNQTSTPRHGEMHEDQLAQMLVDMQEGNEEYWQDENSEEESKDESKGIYLMVSDDEEDKEEFEIENVPF